METGNDGSLLDHIQDELRGLGMVFDHLDESDELAMPSLLIDVPPDDEGRERRLSLAVLPDDDTLGYLDLVQFYMDLPVSGSVREMAQRLPEVNQNSVLGHASVREPDGEAYFRLMWPVGRGTEVDGDELLELIQLFVFAADLATAALGGAGTE